MKYLLIQNQGQIDPFDLNYMGASDKRNDNSKIGFFGSGNKYALATLLKNKIPFRIFSGLDEIEVKTKTIKRPGKEMEFQNFYFEYKGQVIDTSHTVEMGPQWQPWFAVREVYCNAIDEGGVQVVPMVSDITPMEGVTRFYIGVTEPIEPVISNWDKYFSNDRIDLFQELPGLKIFYRRDKGLRIYRKGILVHEEEAATSLFDYDLEDVSINESRVLEHVYNARWVIERTIGQHGNKELLQRILFGLHMGEIDRVKIFEAECDFDYHIAKNKDNWKAAIEGFTLINRSVAGNYMEQQTGDQYLLLPSGLIKSLVDKTEAEVTTFGIPRKGVVPFREYAADENQLVMLNTAIKFLEKAGYECEGIEFQIVKFDNAALFGATNMINKIFVGNNALEHGVRKVAFVILEELFHIESKLQDETRAFQNFILSKTLNEIEKRSGQFL